MKRLIVTTHRLFYYLIAAKKASFICSLIYVSTLNLVILYGFGLLLGDLLATSVIIRLYQFPFIIALFLIMFGAMYVIAPDWKYIELKRKVLKQTTVFIYTGISFLVLLYVVLLKYYI